MSRTYMQRTGQKCTVVNFFRRNLNFKQLMTGLEGGSSVSRESPLGALATKTAMATRKAKKTTLHAVLYISLPLLHDYDMEREQRPPFFCPELLYSPLKFNSKKIANELREIRWNKRNEFKNSANTLCNWRFRSRRRRCWLSSLLIEIREKQGTLSLSDLLYTTRRKTSIIMVCTNLWK